MYSQQWLQDWDVVEACSYVDGLHIIDDTLAPTIMDHGQMQHMQSALPSQSFPSKDFPDAQDFDAIRFATYRTACKLRYIQRKTNLHLVDIWNMIEAFRENGLNTLDSRTEVNVSRLETLITSIYYHLNKRLPVGQQISIEMSTNLLLNWLLAAFDTVDAGKVYVFSIKMALALMCSGKLMDKLRYVFSQISDQNGHLIPSKFAEFLHEALTLPAAVYESPSFGYRDSLPATVFDLTSKVNVNDFLDTIMSEPSPECLLWLPLLHRLASVENVLHPVQCDGCSEESFTGFRYKCQRCANYQLCQDCFWKGYTSGSHTIEHEMKEYATFKSPSKQLGHTLRKSFRCVPEKPDGELPRFPEEPEKTLNLQHIVPPSPMPSHNGLHDSAGYDVISVDSRTSKSSPSKMNSSLESKVDDEHRLIARYAARLAADANHAARSPSELSLNLDTSRAQRELIAQLESKNREIMREIIRLRQQQEMEDQALASQQNPTLLAELRALRQRKEELERHLSTLQESRRELMVQLESLMKLLKQTSIIPWKRPVDLFTYFLQNRPASPRSVPNCSLCSGGTRSPPLSSSPHRHSSSSRSAPTTPGSFAPSLSLSTSADSASAAGDVRLAFGQSPSSRSLCNNLLEAADSVTCAMSSLVKELNSGFVGIYNDCSIPTRDVESFAVAMQPDYENLWTHDDQHFLEDPVRLNQISQDILNNALISTHYEILGEDRPYVKPDDDEAGNCNWDDGVNAWISY